MSSEMLTKDPSASNVKTAIVSPYLVRNGCTPNFDDRNADFSIHQLTHLRFPNDRYQEHKSSEMESSSHLYRDHKPFDSNNGDREHRNMPSADNSKRINQSERLNDNRSIYSQTMNKRNFPLVLENHYTSFPS